MGLEYILDLLDPGKSVSTVTLQKSGHKGLDDVVVTFADGTSRFIQVKHTRVADSLTFGDVVTGGENEDSLLKHMAAGWVAAGKPAEVYLVTNRRAGTRKYTPQEAGSITRPALADFLIWLGSESKGAAALSAMQAKAEWKQAWEDLWLPELADLETDATKLAFLKVENRGRSTALRLARIATPEMFESCDDAQALVVQVRAKPESCTPSTAHRDDVGREAAAR